MTQAAKRGLLIGVVVVAVVTVVAWRVVRLVPRAHVHTIDGATIIALDPERRTAEIEFIHPRSGLPRQVKGVIPEGCPIYLNGEPAVRGLAELRVGDTGSVCGVMHPDQSIEAQWVRLTRPATPSQPTSASSQPATTQAADHP